MASSALTNRCVPFLCKLSRGAHSSSNNSNLTKNLPFSKNKSKSLTTKRSLQSIAHLKDTNGRIRNVMLDPIQVGARKISTDPCLSSVTLGELREAKYLSQKLQEKILRWIWEGESWSIFAENDIQITKVKLLPNFETLKIYWSATGRQYIDNVIQQTLDESVSAEIRGRMKSQNFPGEMMPRIEFIADMLHIQASELAAGQHSQHPPSTSHDAETNQNATELQRMKIQTGISSLKMIDPVSVNGANTDFHTYGEDYIERSQIQGLDYQTVLAEILKNPSSLRF